MRRATSFLSHARSTPTTKILSVLTKHHGCLYKMTNECYQDHMAGTDTYYFQGEGRPDHR